MRNRSAVAQRRSPVMVAAWFAIFSLVGVGLVGGAVWYLGLLNQANRPQSPSYAGMVAVPASGMAIPAYTAVTREHLVDVEGGRPIKVFYLKPELVSADMITDLARIRGRVLARDKAAGYVFTESDFLPEGTRAGLVGGIPPGKRAIVLDAEKIRGLKHLRIGDRFDLLASTPLEMGGLQPRARSAQSGRGRSGGDLGPKGETMMIRLLVAQGAVVTAADRAAPAGKPVDMTIALAADEIGPLTAAMAGKAELFCVARSGHVDAQDDNSPTPDSNPLENVSVIETVRGRKFNLEAFPTDRADNPVQQPAVPEGAAEVSPDAARRLRRVGPFAGR